MDLFKQGICECKAAGKWKWTDVGLSKRILMCVKCNRPKEWSKLRPPITKGPYD